MGGSDARALSRSLLDLCRMRKLTIATAESCTGGLVAGIRLFPRFDEARFRRFTLALLILVSAAILIR